MSAGITLFDGFSALDNIKIARTSLAMGQDLEHQEEDRVCLATMEAYYNVVYYTLLVDILSEQVDNARSALTLASRQEELGVKGYADVVQMKADLADREYELVCARNSLTGARISLEDIMLWPVGEPLEIDTDEVLLSGGEEEDCSGHAGTDGTQTLDGIVRSAQKTLPSVLIAKGTLDNAKYALHTARWQFLPTLSLYGGWSTSYYTYPGQAGYTPTPYWKQFVNNGGEYLQLSLNIPIYDRLSKLTLLSKRRNEYRRAEISYDKSLRDVESEVRRAVSDLNGTRAELTRASLRAELQEEAFRLNSRKYEQGLISAIEYNTASANHLKAEAERLNALLQYRLKSHVVEYYGGTRYIDQK